MHVSMPSTAEPCTATEVRTQRHTGAGHREQESCLQTERLGAGVGLTRELPLKDVSEAGLELAGAAEAASSPCSVSSPVPLF